MRCLKTSDLQSLLTIQKRRCLNQASVAKDGLTLADRNPKIRDTMVMRSILLLSLIAPLAATAQPLETKPKDPSFEKFNPMKAPENKGLFLKRGDRLAICGDSITEQKMYSRIIEDYLTMCV